MGSLSPFLCVMFTPTSLSPSYRKIGNDFYHHDSNVAPIRAPLRHMRIMRGQVWLFELMWVWRCCGEFIRQWELIEKNISDVMATGKPHLFRVINDRVGFISGLGGAEEGNKEWQVPSWESSCRGLRREQERSIETPTIHRHLLSFANAI